VGGRGNLQLRAWELEDYLDEEARIFTDARRKDDSQSIQSHESQCQKDDGDGHTKDAEKNFPAGLSSLHQATAATPFAITATMDTKAIAPFAEPFDDGGPSSLHPPLGNSQLADKKLIRPKVFGPERIVEDPRIKAVHGRLLWEIYVVALCGSLVSVKDSS
jgi:hypothetical protein